MTFVDLSTCLYVRTLISEQQPDLYPTEELQWLAATSFNRAVDFYCSSLVEDCRRWAEIALRLAGLCRDGGALHRTLRAKYQELTW